MAVKKEKQWKIDRAFKITGQNEIRLRNILQSIRPVKTGAITKDQAIKKMADLGVLAVRDEDTARGRSGYEQSTATLPRSYGLICKDAYETSEVADLYLDGQLSFKNLFTIQCIKKEYIYNEEQGTDVLNPIIVTLKVMLEIQKKDKKLAWFDSYDYFNYLVEIKELGDIEKVAAEMAESNSLGSHEHDFMINDFDMWAGVFEVIGLFVLDNENDRDVRTAKFRLNEKEMPFIEWLTKQKYEILNTSKKYRSEEEQRRFGMVDSSIISKIPKINVDLNKEYEIVDLVYDGKNILESYLYDGKSFRAIEKDSFGMDENMCKGYLAKTIIESYGIGNEEKGMFAPFVNRKELVKLSMASLCNTKLYKTLYDIEEPLIVEKEPKTTAVERVIDKSVKGYNKIYYGIPGCGKSYHIENKVLAGVNKKEDVFRTTFFLDYSNSDFVGQIYPVVEGDRVTYKYVPGPFTKALERALTTADGHMVYLVIEEINRGNAAAIFGDLFQLLDRLSVDKEGRVICDSEYPISNQFIEGYFSERNKNGQKIPFNQGQVFIPNNLTILATMNTSDQNVFPLDTAFQRRWDREKVVAKLEGSEYADLYVPGTEIKWKDFAAKTNFHMIEDCGDKSVTEDKNLGAYFATDAMLCYEDDAPEVKKEKAIRFANNVMEYLFGTAVKFAPEILFDKDYDRYQKVYDKMESFMFDVDQSEAFISMLAKNLREDIKKTITASPASAEDGE